MGIRYTFVKIPLFNQLMVCVIRTWAGTDEVIHHNSSHLGSHWASSLLGFISLVLELAL